MTADHASAVGVRAVGVRAIGRSDVSEREVTALAPRTYVSRCSATGCFDATSVWRLPSRCVRLPREPTISAAQRRGRPLATEASG